MRTVLLDEVKCRLLISRLEDSATLYIRAVCYVDMLKLNRVGGVSFINTTPFNHIQLAYCFG